MSLKAFELVPVINKISVGNEKSKGSISCMDLSQDNLYLGTTDSFVIHFAIEQGISPTGKTTFMNKLQRHKQLGLKHSINQLLACSAIGHLLILVDGNVYVSSMYGLELRNYANSREFLKGVTVMALNKKPPVFNPEEVQVCFGTKRKSVLIYTLTNASYILLKEINLTDPPSVLAIDGECLCTTLGSQYFIINYVSSDVQELFMYEAHNVKPIIKRTGSQEFLLNGPTDSMGLIVKSDGVSSHQPFSWSDGLHSVAYSYPYILVLGDSTVTIHSILDQKQKQAMSFQGGVTLSEFDKHIFIAMPNAVLSFIPIPFSKQIQMLLIDKRIDEAFDILLVASKLDSKQYDAKYTKQIQMQAGFIYFADTKFDKAKELFVQSSIDPREVIVLYPLMLPKNKVFTASRPFLHNIKDLTVVVKGSKTIFAEAKKFLLKFLELCRENKFPDANVEIDTALMKLYSECNHPKLSALLSTSNECYVDETISWLTQFKRFHSLALFYCFLKQEEKAVDIWKKIIHKEVDDTNFPGPNFVVKYLSEVKNEKLIWNSLPWLLDLDQEIGIKVVKERHDDVLDSDKVICFLQQKYHNSLRIFLEHLVFEKDLQKERFHTQLAVIYVDDVVKHLTAKIKVQNDIENSRKRLQTMLEKSSVYRISTLLQKISNLPLYNEIAILYGKMDQHDKALKILVYKLQDFDAAERYCDVITDNKDERVKRNIFHTLLNLYLNPLQNEDNESLRAEHLVVPAVKLLNSRWKEFDTIQLLRILPEDWCVDMIKPFLTNSVRTSLTTVHQSKIQSSLTRQHYLDTKFSTISLQAGVINMTDERKCDFCKKPFNEPISVKYPNGVVIHAHCYKNKHICPVTGQKFD